MGTLNTSRSASADQARYGHYGVVAENFTYAMTATASAGDVIELFKVGPGAHVMQLMVGADTAAMAYSVGDGGDTGRFMSTASSIATAVYTAGGVQTANREINIPAGVFYSYSAADTVDIKIVNGGGATTTVYVAALVSYAVSEDD